MRDIQPRVIRLRDAPGYLGMDKNRFNAEVRPDVPEYPIGSQGVGFDRLDLDAWFDDYKSRNGRQAKKGGNKPWRERKSRGSSTGTGFGGLRRDGAVAAFEKALARATSMKPKDT